MEIKRLTALAAATVPRKVKPTMWLIHATRGPVVQEAQGVATIDWFTRSAPTNGGLWAPTADVLIDHAGNVYEFRDIPNERGNYSAGYGDVGPFYGWAADEKAISVELAQSDQLEPFTAATIEALITYVRQRTKDWNLDIPAKRLYYWDQLFSTQVPRGWIGHEDTANGQRLGKTDPGDKFPWEYVLAKVAAPEVDTVDMSAPVYTVTKAVKTAVLGKLWAYETVGAYADKVAAEWSPSPRGPEWVSVRADVRV